MNHTPPSETASSAGAFSSAEITSAVLEQLSDALAEKPDLTQMPHTTKLRDDLNLHSLEAVSMVMELEDQFDIEVEDEELQELETIGDVIELIRAKADAS